MGNAQLAIIIPAYNEESTIAQIVDELKKKYTVIVINDCSTDKTEFLAKDRGAFVINHTTNLGYEESLNSGFQYAIEVLNFEAILTIDADGEHDIRKINLFENFLLNDKVPLVLGKRDKKNRVIESILSYFIKKIFGISDIFCGMKGYRSALWKVNRKFDTVKSVGTELTLSAIRGGIEFKEIPIKTLKRNGQSRYGIGFNTYIRIICGITKAMFVKKILPNELS